MIERPESLEFFFRPGLTWPLRTDKLSFRVLPAGCVFGHKGPAAFVSDNNPESLLTLAALMNSRSFYIFVQMMVARTSLAQSFEVGLIQLIPVPNLSDPNGAGLSKLAYACLEVRRNLDRINETSHVFYLPALLYVNGGSLEERTSDWQAHLAKAEQQLADHQREINDITFRLYGIDDDGRATVENYSEQPSEGGQEEWGIDSPDEEVEAEPTADVERLTAELISYAIGCVLGRWDVRFATGNDNLPHCLILLPHYLCVRQAYSRARSACHCIRSQSDYPSASLGTGSSLTTPALRELSPTRTRSSAG